MADTGKLEGGSSADAESQGKGVIGSLLELAQIKNSQVIFAGVSGKLPQRWAEMHLPPKLMAMLGVAELCQ